MDPYEPPRADARAPTIDEDAALGGPGPLVGLAGAALGASGILTAVAGWQLGDMLIGIETWIEVWMWSFLPIGLVQAICGGGFTQARAWSLIPGIVAAGLAGASGIAWVIWAVLHGVFTMASLAAASTSACAFGLALVAHGRARTVADARRKLMDQV